jgi:tetratricopeptide (TPR) repeat protein
LDGDNLRAGHQNVINVYHLRQTLSVAQPKFLLQQAVNFCPNHAYAHNNLGVLLEQAGDNTAALSYYRQAVSSQLCRSLARHRWLISPSTAKRSGGTPMTGINE